MRRDGIRLRLLSVRAVLLAGIAVMGASCCAPVPRADKYFHRDWGFTETLRQFQYAVETQQYDIAYQCLSPPDQAEFSQAKFELLLWLGTVEVLRDVKVRDAITDSVYDGDWEWENAEETRAYGVLEYENEERRVSASIRFYLVKIPSGEWRIDLRQTASQFNLSE